MLDAPMIIAQLLGLATALAVIGEPLRLLLSRFSRIFGNLDFTEICVLDIYLGGLILYVLALAPLYLFTMPMILSILLVFTMISVACYFRRQKEFSGSAMCSQGQQGMVIEQAFFFACFLILLCIQIFPMTSLFYGSIHDVSLHSFMVQVILEKKYVPYTLEPYSSAGIIYPQAAHVIFAFAANLMGWIAPQAVTYVTSLFNALTVFGAYFLARRIWRQRIFYLGLVFVSTFVSAWPIFIVWGSNPFVVGFALFQVCLGMLFTLFFTSSKIEKKELFIIGVLFGYLSAIMISYLQSLMMITLLWLLFLYLRRRRGVGPSLKDFVFMFSVSILPLTPFLFRFVYYYPYLGHNIGLPADFMGYPKGQHWIAQGLQWIFENLAPHPVLRLEILCVVIFSIILFFKVRRQTLSGKAFSAALLVFSASVLLGVVSYLLPGDVLGVVSWGHQGIIIIISVCLLMAILNDNLFTFFHRVVSRSQTANSDKIYIASLASILVLSVVYAPFVYTRLVVDPSTLNGAYGMFAVASKDDNELMLWIRDNVENDAVILVNMYEAGTFIPSVSYRKTIFTDAGSQLSRSYQEIVALLSNGTLNAACYHAMKNFGITHIYVGSKATFSWVKDYKWKQQLFLGNPSFPLVKRVGEAYLFNFSYVDTSVLFLDDFEHDYWDDYGWRMYLGGNGLGNTTIKAKGGFEGSRGLKLSSRAVPKVLYWMSASWIRREMFVLNNSRVTLSFYLNATEGFHNKDTLAVLISNIYRNQSMVITTPNGIYDDYVYAIVLNENEGSFTVDLSVKWQQRFNSSLPHPFILEFVNYDFDGIENVAYIDNVEVTSEPAD